MENENVCEMHKKENNERAKLTCDQAFFFCEREREKSLYFFRLPFAEKKTKKQKNKTHDRRLGQSGVQNYFKVK